MYQNWLMPKSSGSAVASAAAVSRACLTLSSAASASGRTLAEADLGDAVAAVAVVCIVEGRHGLLCDTARVGTRSRVGTAALPQ